MAWRKASMFMDCIVVHYSRLQSISNTQNRKNVFDFFDFLFLIHVILKGS